MPARKRTTTGPTPVGAITHADKRANLPTSDAADFVDPQIDQPTPGRYPRDPTLDPQLVWKGKDELDGEDLVADAPAIYIQEKIDPRVIIENLRNTAGRPEDEPELTLFDTFDGLGDLDLVDFYRHQANWSNRMILGDSLNVMASLAEREALRGKVQMIYIGPPYGIKFGSNWQVSARKRDVKDGKLEDASREVEQIKAFRDTWELGIHSYLTYLRDRLTVARDLLTDSGSVFVQIGDENVHLVRSLMDEVFGSENFAGMFSFRTKIPLRTTLVPAIYDHILWYAKDLSSVKFRRLFRSRKVGSGSQFTWVQESSGRRRRLTADELAMDDPSSCGRLFRLTDLVSAGRTESYVEAYSRGKGRCSWKGTELRLFR
jgi:adenine-specific DNA-methyltransferase